jgi:hypothetical protein
MEPSSGLSAQEIAVFAFQHQLLVLVVDATRITTTPVSEEVTVAPRAEVGAVVVDRVVVAGGQLEGREERVVMVRDGM